MTAKRFYIKNERTIKDNMKYVTENGYVLSFRNDAEELCNLLNALAEENEQLKKDCSILVQSNQEYRKENEQLKQQINKLEAQLHCPFDSICIKCNNEYLVQKGEYYVSRCKKGHEQCSKTYVRYCDDFELKGDDGND